MYLKKILNKNKQENFKKKIFCVDIQGTLHNFLLFFIGKILMLRI